MTVVQASQSELDLEKFAASILLEDGPLSAAADLSAPGNPATPLNLGQARCSDSSLQGSNSGWEAMLMDSSSVEPFRAGLEASMDASPASDLTTIGMLPSFQYTNQHVVIAVARRRSLRNSKSMLGMTFSSLCEPQE